MTQIMTERLVWCKHKAEGGWEVSGGGGDFYNELCSNECKPTEREQRLKWDRAL